MPLRDKVKQRAYWNAWYHRDPSKQKVHIDRIRKRNWLWFDSIKSKLFCCKCGEKDICCLDFHHNGSGEKELNMSVMRRSTYSIKRMQEEMDKCLILCSNCHRKLHGKEYTHLIGNDDLLEISTTIV